jgi:hypothetical protein
LSRRRPSWSSDADALSACRPALLDDSLDALEIRALAPEELAEIGRFATESDVDQWRGLAQL